MKIRLTYSSGDAWVYIDPDDIRTVRRVRLKEGKATCVESESGRQVLVCELPDEIDRLVRSAFVASREGS